MLRCLPVLCALALVFATPEPRAQRVLEHEVVLDAPVAEIWDLWTTAEGLRSWMAPFVRVDLRPGGKIESNYDPSAQAGDEGNIHLEILAYDPRRMLCLRGVVPDMFPQAQAEGRDLWSVTTFEPAACGTATRLTMRGHGYGEGGDWDRMYRFFEAANQGLLDSLVARYARPEGEADAVLAAFSELAEGTWVQGREAGTGAPLVMDFGGRVGDPWRRVRTWAEDRPGEPHLHTLTLYGRAGLGVEGWEFGDDGQLWRTRVTLDGRALVFHGTPPHADEPARSVLRRLDARTFELTFGPVDGPPTSTVVYHRRDDPPPAEDRAR